MQASYPAEFTREHGCTEAEWLKALPGAVGVHELSLAGAGLARVSIGPCRPATAGLALNWQVLPPRRIALAQFPRLQVDYRFDGLDDAGRAAFMRYFDLYIQRGGG